MVINKKVAILCNYELLADRVGGMDHFFWQFDAKCKQNGVDVYWFFPNHAQHGEYFKLNIIESKEQNVETFFLTFCNNNKTDYAYIITHFVELCTSFFYKIKKFSNAKIIVVDHNPRPINGYSFVKKIKKRIKGLLNSKYIDTFIGVSDYTKKEIVKDFGEYLKRKIITIYNGVAIENIKVRKTRNVVNPTFIVASHLRESKGIQDLIDAVSLLPDFIKTEIRIAIFGEGPFKDNLIAKIKDKKLQANFQFMGSSANLNELYCQYDYMLQPTHMECFSLSILESLAANVPVITTNVGGNEEAITDGENGFITDSKNTFLLQDLLKKVYLGEKKISKNTRQLVVDTFSLNQMVENHFTLIQ
ncbi:Glycosyltransferase involved in cell wall bisynthesis [Flavobacterium segetis]|uniref:Glycosyltransferase involved in cell wall bisynthesis n=1 Tax=Flavobacterium segetis TaxID=271157 RepID=A0A1M5GSQ2_9FLAO|nr:glycosyltransferase family 4 protein [Flavobacterium segetis]SHG06749.1 Glycosyltransferase involved in cell wall bisynthesis [Flavobacterium segetis]